MSSTLPGADVRGFYEALGIELPDWTTVEASVRCFADPAAHAHDDRNPSCSLNLKTGAWHCWGCGAKGGAYDAARELDFSPREAMDLLIHYQLAERRTAGGGRRRTAPQRATRSAPARKRPAPRLAVSQRDIACWKHALLRHPWPLAQLRPEHRRLWQRKVADELDLGWDRGRVTIPIRDADKGLQGVLRYRPRPGGGPKMLAMSGSRLGPIPHPSQEPSAWLLLVEGPPDLIAGRSRGLPAIAIPGDYAWDRGWAQLFAGRRVAIAMDCDRQGRAAAQRITADLQATSQAVHVADVAPHLGDGYDLTDWLDHHLDLSPSTLRALFEP
jgi:hypothetical protein